MLEVGEEVAGEEVRWGRCFECSGMGELVLRGIGAAFDALGVSWELGVGSWEALNDLVYRP